MVRDFFHVVAGEYWPGAERRSAQPIGVAAEMQERLLEDGAAATESAKVNIHAVTGSRRRQAYDEMLCRRNLLLSVLGLGQLVLMIVMLEAGYRTECEPLLSSAEAAAGADNRTGCPPPDEIVATTYARSLVNPICIAIASISLVSLLVLYNYYALKWHAYCKLTLQPKDPVSTPFGRPPHFWRGHMAGSFALEFLFLVVQPVPAMPRVWFEIVSLIMFFKLYLFVRVLRDFSTAFSVRELLRQEGALPGVNWRLALKAVYAERPGRTLGVVCVASVLIFSFAIHVTDRDDIIPFQVSEDALTSRAVWFVLAKSGSHIGVDAAIPCLAELFLCHVVYHHHDDHRRLWRLRAHVGARPRHCEHRVRAWDHSAGAGGDPHHRLSLAQWPRGARRPARARQLGPSCGGPCGR